MEKTFWGVEYYRSTDFSVLCWDREGEKGVKSLASSFAAGLFSSYVESNKGFCHATKKGTAT